MALTQTNEEGLKVSNAPSDGKFLQYKDSTDKLTWATAGAGTMSNVVEDTTPQLGGNLDVNGQEIISGSTNGNIDINPNGTGDINLKTAVGGTTNLTSGGDVWFPSSVTNQLISWDYSDSQLEFWDGTKAVFGSGDDFEIYHDETDNQIKSGNGKVVISTTAGNSDIELTPNGSGDVVIDGLKYPQADGSAGQFLKTDGSAQLSWDTVSTSITTTSGTDNFTVADGNLVIGTAGHGVDFSATADAGTTGSSMTTELLDWYEEGTWTPSITFGGTSNFAGGSMGSSLGVYTRVGRIVTANFDTVVSAKGSSSGHVHLNGLPFSSGGSAHRCGTCLAFNTWMDTDQKCSRTRMYLGDSRTYIQLIWNSLDNLNASDCNASGQICGIITYQVP